MDGMQRLKSELPFIIILLIIFGCDPRHEVADLIISGTIYTGNNDQPIADACAVKDGVIIFVGSNREAIKYQGDNTRMIDLAGQVMTAGFIEGHAHLMEIGYNKMQVDLSSAKNYDEIIDRVREAVEDATPGEWIIGRGWHQDKWDKQPDTLIGGFQTHHRLSGISPDNPVYLTHASGHAAMANAKAMQIAGVNVLSRERGKYGVAGGEITMDAWGNPTGIFSENAMALIESRIPKKTEESDAKALELALQACSENGITSFHDAGASSTTIDLYNRFKTDKRLSVRLYVMLENDSALLNEWFKKGPYIDSANQLSIRAIKLYTDGALGSRGAWLLEPYTDRPDYSGAPTMSMNTVYKIACEGLQHGFQVCSHAIGDRANREVLNAYERAFSENPDKALDHRFRIEHAQHLHPDDIPRFARLGVIPAMQAIHMSSDRPWAINRLGQVRISEGAYAWRSLLSAGARIVNGTDAPVEPLNPLACFYASIARKTLDGHPDGGFEPHQKMTREQALRSYTLDAAYAAFEEKFKGSIEVGKLADFTVFSKDIMRIPEDSLLTTHVTMTMVGGKIRYERK
jgi:predicted amidohydrolase YtcJ